MRQAALPGVLSVALAPRFLLQIFVQHFEDILAVPAGNQILKKRCSSCLCSIPSDGISISRYPGCSSKRDRMREVRIPV